MVLLTLSHSFCPTCPSSRAVHPSWPVRPEEYGSPARELLFFDAWSFLPWLTRMPCWSVAPTTPEIVSDGGLLGLSVFFKSPELNADTLGRLQKYYSLLPSKGRMRFFSISAMPGSENWKSFAWQSFSVQMFMRKAWSDARCSWSASSRAFNLLWWTERRVPYSIDPLFLYSYLSVTSFDYKRTSFYTTRKDRRDGPAWGVHVVWLRLCNLSSMSCGVDSERREMYDQPGDALAYWGMNAPALWSATLLAAVSKRK